MNNYIVYYNIIVMCLLKSMCIPSFILICGVSELYGHLCPYRKYGPRLSIAVFTELFIYLLSLHQVFSTPSSFRDSKYISEVVYCFYKNYIVCQIVYMFLSLHQVSLLHT